MSKAVFGFGGSTAGNRPTLLEAPSAVYVARQLDEVMPLIISAEASARTGAWVALMLSYESAPAFDVALRTHASGRLPLAWAAVFPRASEIETIPHLGSYAVGNWEPGITRSRYDADVARIHELIAAGHTYQVNHCYPLRTSFSGDSLSWYFDLCSAQGAGYFAYLDLGKFKILSLSPELFFERKGNELMSRPMKGTIKRGRWATEDRERGSALQRSEKDRAENVMIVDLIRNDIGKVAALGTVRVPQLFQLEKFETLWQLTSTVVATIRPQCDLAELLKALFPCGSVTGAPKVRTMEIIRELEAFPRQVYTGSIGLIRPGGDCVFSVAIRTVLLDCASGKATFGVGGGITTGSTASGEYDECQTKIAFLNRKPKSFELLEALLLEDGSYFLLAEHLSRLQASASYFNFCFDYQQVATALQSTAKEYSRGRWKIRLVTKRDGQLDIRTEALPDDLQPKFRVAFANRPVNSEERWLFHKTTNRQVYEEAVADRPDCDDVILWNERGEVTESTIANLVVPIAEELWTPPQAAGLLGGTFRERLLTAGRIRERVILKEELRATRNFHLINSVRKWMPATLVD